MNPKGHQKNLKAKHPANKNAAKAGVYSSQRRAEEADEVRQTLTEDPQRFLSEDETAMYAELRGHLKLLEVDLAERGVTDRTGKQRRQAGTYLRTLRACLDLNDRIQARRAADELEKIMKHPWSEEEAVERLCEIARNPSEPASARITAIRTLHALVPTAPKPDLAFYEELEAMSAEELEREIAAMMVPITTDPRHPSTEPQWHGGRDSAQRMIRKLAMGAEITKEQLHVLYEALTEDLQVDG
jgi:hypothetical protein